MSNSITPPIIPTTGYLRLPQIIGTLAASPRKKKDPEKTGAAEEKNETEKPDRKTEAPFYHPLIPVSKSTWWAGVRSGRYPAPVRHLGQRITAWKAEAIRQLIEEGGK
jgi:predicted DNA-binding transcriptional regulator AlpA